LELAEVDILFMMISALLIAITAVSTALAVYAIMVERENKRLKKELEEKQRATPAQG